MHGPKDAHLVVKIHPLDPGLRRWPRIIAAEAEAAGMEARVHFIDGGSLDRLIASSLGVITVNSTVGIWGLRAHKPVITLGSAIYDINGLTFQNGLDRFWTEAEAPGTDVVEDFTTALAETIQIRGVYYNRPGLDAAVAGAVKRLDRGEGETIAVRLANTNEVPGPRRPATAAGAAATRVLRESTPPKL
jgi:capsular polysaccharide export protein